MFLFEATEADEITVKEGEVVEVIDKSTDQDGWWMVRREGGQEGLVPDNFLEVIEKGSSVVQCLGSNVLCSV